MHPIIKEILDKDITVEKKAAEVAELKESIELAERIFSGEFTYCKKCGDFFLSKSFLVDTEIITERVCTYSDPINGDFDVQYKKVRYTYKICPKGCKHQINREERWKQKCVFIMKFIQPQQRQYKS